MFFLIVAATIGIGVHKAVDFAVSSAIQRDGEVRLRQWAGYINSYLPDLEEIVATDRPTPEQVQKLEIMRDVGNVFRFKLFAPDGKLILVSDATATRTSGDSVGGINSLARTAFQSGESHIAVKSGKDDAGTPNVYVQSYVRAHGAKGQPIGIFEIFIDQTKMATFLQAIFGWAAAGLALLGSLAYLIPAFAFLQRNADATRAEDQISYLTEFDPLTSLMSRRSFTQQLDEALARPYAYLRTDAILFIDIDNFKSVNDEYGHEGGDQFIVHVANAIKSQIQGNGYAARFGGDEFTVCLPGITETSLRKTCNKILAEARKPARCGNQVIKGKISIGVHINHKASTSADLLRAADIALYNAKDSGKNRFVVFNEDMAYQLNARRDLERRLQGAHENEQFELNYQPIIDSTTSKIAGFEALLRLPDGNGGYIPPDEFIPVAESIGLIAPISKWAMHEALTTARTWPGDLFIAINLSPRQFEDGNLVATIKSAVEQTGFPPERLELEVTESLFLGNTESVDLQIKELKNLGASIALDDFGTGYSSIGYLIRYGFNKLKVDRSFLVAHDKDPDKLHGVLETIVSLGHGLGMHVTAEGIETAEQARMLGELKCDQFQGFYFGRPMDREKVAITLLHSTADTMAEVKQLSSGVAAGKSRKIAS
ncbi:MAG: bifunctional diguanylate cyclase/phosphodiesterase [Anderseniella sp.]